MFAYAPWRMAGTMLLIILGCFGCSLFGLVNGNELRSGYNEQFVPMVDPAGRDPERDLTYSQANRNNSEANLHNAQAVKELAIATAIIRQSEYDDPLYMPKEVSSMTTDAFTRGMLLVVGAIFVFVIVFVVRGMLGKSGGDESNLSRR